MGDRIVYSFEGGFVPIVYTKRANAPECGDVFTAQAIERQGKRDLVIDAISNHTGYIKKNLKDYVVAAPGNYYRFKIVGGPHCKNRHNYYSVVPLRKLSGDESHGLNKIDCETALLVQKLGEFAFGLKWDKNKKKYFRLGKRRGDWDWFEKMFM